MPKAAVTFGTFSSTTAVRKVKPSPMAACFHRTAPRFSLIAKAMARSAKTPTTDCKVCMRYPESPARG